MSYSVKECDLIVADSLNGLNFKQKKLLLASLNKENANPRKYADALINMCGESVYNKARATLQDENYRKNVLQELDKKSVKCVTYKSAGYPEQLKQIPTPPLVLYARGNTELLKGDTFAVVGSRKTLPAVYEQCKRISRELSEKLVIVTGVAEGADSAAALGALETGNVICVLPGGHDSGCYANAKILKQAEKNGLVISEFPAGKHARKYSYFLRNRIIAGLSKGVLIVSAADRSGALNTASYAADYSRDVFAFPYGLGITSGEGCNNLIKNGAYLCDSANDVLCALGYGAKEPTVSVTLNEDEAEILELLRQEGETHLEKIAAATGKQLFEVNALCASLEIKGLAIRSGGNKYSAV